MTTAAFPPGPKDWMPYRLAVRLLRDPITFIREAAQTYGDIVHVHSAGRDFVLLNHPDLIQDVLVTHNHNVATVEAHLKRILGEGLVFAEGDMHMRQRRALQPMFKREHIVHHAAAIVEHTERYANGWQDGATVLMHEELLRLTQVIAGKALFDVDVATETERLSRLIGVAAKSGFVVQKLPLAHFLEKLPFTGGPRFTAAMHELHVFVQGLIDEHRRTGKDRGDVLSRMLKLRDELGPQDFLTDDMLRQQILTLYVAGHETTATGLTWTLYLLSRHPDVEAKLHAEVDAVLGGRVPTAADVLNLPYTEMVFAEAMRLYPPIYWLARRQISEFPLGGYVFPAGTHFFMSQAVVQHDPRWFPEPLKFEPERMSHERRSTRPRFAYFPFGGGPHQCIGEAFAWLEGVLVVATLARHWRFRCTSEEAPRTRLLITCIPRDGLPMRLERRHPSPAEGLAP